MRMARNSGWYRAIQARRLKADRTSPRAMTLVESATAIVLVSVMLAAALTTMGVSKTGQRSMNLRRQGHTIGQALMAEILDQAYADSSQLDSLLDQLLGNSLTSSLTLGPETGESTGNRGAFDDVDDYDGWSELPPQTKSGAAMSELSGWRRAVTVVYVKKDDVNTTRSADEGAKRITVSVAYNNNPIVTLVALKTLGPPPTELCCLSNGISMDARDSNCTTLGGTAAGTATSTLNLSCSGSSSLAPVARWNCDEGSGSSTTDSIGGFVATLSGAGWATGKWGSSLSFDGINDVAQVPNDSKLILTSKYSIVAWIYKDSVAGYDSIIMKGTSVALNSTYTFRTDGDEVGFGFANTLGSMVTTTSANLTTGTWYHVAGTYDSTSSTIKVYVNGVQSATGSTLISPPSTTAAVRFGRSDAGDYFHGRIDDLRIYDVVLTQQQITDIMNGSG